jgi:hypothetical protein
MPPVQQNTLNTSNNNNNNNHSDNSSGTSSKQPTFPPTLDALLVMSSNVTLILLICCYLHRRRSTQRTKRAAYLRDIRVDVSALIDHYRGHKDLTRVLRFPIDSFELLCDILRDSLTRDPRMAELRGGYITPEACVFLTLRWLAGGQYADLMYLVGCSRSSFYKLLWMTIDAIITSKDPHLDNIKFPETEEERDKASQGFESISYGGAIPNCISVIDGYLLKIRTPPKKRCRQCTRVLLWSLPTSRSQRSSCC